MTLITYALGYQNFASYPVFQIGLAIESGTILVMFSKHFLPNIERNEIVYDKKNVKLFL